MAFAKFNQCSPCCDCRFYISATVAGSGISGVTITARDINGSGVGSCVTTSSGCSISIEKPGNYYIHNDYCNTTQLIDIAKCGNNVNVIIPSVQITMIANSECFFDVPKTQFHLTGPQTDFTATASGNILIGVLPFPQLAAAATAPGPHPSGTYTLTVSDIEDNHYSHTVNADEYCQLNSISTYMIKKWGYACSPWATAAGCPTAGVVISDSDGHTSITESDGLTHDKWKYIFEDEIPTEDNSYTTITVEKPPFISPCPNGCVQLKPRCFPEPPECPDKAFFPIFNLLMPDTYWGSPTDECVEVQPDSLTVSFTGFTVNHQSSCVVTRNNGGTGFPYNYAGGQPPNFPDFYTVFIGIYPGCKKPVNNSSLGPLVTIAGDSDRFPVSGLTHLDITGTTACPTMITFIERSNFDNSLTGRSVTVST